MSFKFSTENRIVLRSEKGREFVSLAPVLGSFDRKVVSDDAFDAWAYRILKNVKANERCEQEHCVQLRHYLRKHLAARELELPSQSVKNASISNAINEAIAESNRFMSDMKDVRNEILSIRRDRERQRKRSENQSVRVSGEDVQLYSALVSVEDLNVDTFSVNETEGFIARRFYSLGERV